MTKARRISGSGRRWVQVGIPRRVTALAAVVGALAGGSILVAAAPALAAPETPTTGAANPIGGTTATLNGTLNPGASGTAGYFFYYGKNGYCQETATIEGAEATGKGIKVSTPVTELEGNTEYMVCVVATHTENSLREATEGAPEIFKTLPAEPTAAGGEATGITPFQASVSNISVNPENEPTSCELEYGVKPAYNEKIDCEQASVEGTSPVAVSGTLTKLKSATTYDYRVKAKNGAGEIKGGGGEFTTSVAEAPKVESQSAPKVTATGAELEAQINPNYQETSYKFEYSTDPGLAGAKTAVGTSTLPPEFANEPASVTISGLQPRTTYYYRVTATNATGSTIGPNDESTISEFKTLGVPIVTTGGASPLSITQTAAEVLGTVNPGGASTSWHIAYIDQEEYEEAVEEGVAALGSQGYAEAVADGLVNPYAEGEVTTYLNVGSEEYTPSEVTAKLSELEPGTTYDYAVVAINSAGTTIGPNMTFTTAAPTPPSATTGEPEEVKATSAILTGTVDTGGLQTQMNFEFGETPALGSIEVASLVPGSESGATTEIETVFGSNLQAGTTYYYRAVASNDDGVSYGAIKAFTTASFTALAAFKSSSTTVTPEASPPTPIEVPGTTTPKKTTLTNAQKLAKALKTCAKKPKSKRAACEKQARKKYPTKKKKKKK